MSERIISGLLYSDLKPVEISIRDGMIDSIQRPETSKSDLIIAPGLIDIQVNGYDGVGFSESNLTEEGIQYTVKKLWSLGVTTLLATTITIPKARLLKNLSLLVKSKKEKSVAHSIYGFHMEGPYISEKDGPRGAHNRNWVKEIDQVEFDKYVDGAENQIVLLTLDPSKDGAFEFIRSCVKQSVCIALGHHSASREEIDKAIEAGACLSTHLGNGNDVYVHRHHNSIWPQLADDRLMASVIADGFHLLPEELKVFFRTKTKDKLILISDITNFSGLTPGTYDWQNQQIDISSEGKVSLAGSDMLAGAYSPLIEDLGNMIRFSGCSLSDAIDMATKTPAALLNMNNRGDIKEGKIADLILFSLNDHKLILAKTILCGEEVYSKK
jgi:N-acetylglucosamine-6-phosphate deacetylase